MSVGSVAGEKKRARFVRRSEPTDGGKQSLGQRSNAIFSAFAPSNNNYSAILHEIFGANADGLAHAQT